MIRSESSQKSAANECMEPSKTSIAQLPDANKQPPDANKTAWLVSVRDLAELKQAARFEIEIVDFKEPSAAAIHGPLAPVGHATWRSAVDLVAQSGRDVMMLSAALGEWQQGVAVAEYVPDQFTFAKIGPSECRTVGDLAEMWSQARRQLSDSVELVAVAYADADLANCPDVQSVMEAAAEFGIKRFLIDTFAKDGRNTIDILGQSQLARLAATARSLGMWWTLAGSITSDHVAELHKQGIEPNCFGVRGDVCDTTRTGRLCDQRMKHWEKTLRMLRRSSAESRS